MGDIVGIFGAPVPEAGKPSPALVARLEELLEQARSGEIQGLAGAALFRDGATVVVSAGLANRTLVGTLAIAQTRVVQDILKDES